MRKFYFLIIFTFLTMLFSLLRASNNNTIQKALPQKEITPQTLNNLEERYEHFKYRYPDSSDVYSDKIFALDSVSFDQPTKALFLKLKGTVNFNNSNYSAAADCYTEALHILANEPESQLKAALFVSLGECKSLLTEADAAIDNMYKGLDIYQLLKDTSNQVNSLVTIAEYYRKIRQHEEALKYLDRAGSMTNNQILLSEVGVRMYNRYAAVYSETSQNPIAIQYSLKALRMAKLNGNKSLQATSNNELGHLYQKTGNIKLAEEYYLEAEKNCRETDLKRTLASVLINLSRLTAESGQNRKAMNYMESLELMMEDKPWLNVKMEMYRQKIRIYNALNDYKNAYLTFRLLHTTQIELIKNEFNTKIIETQLKHENREKDWLIENQKQQIKIEKNNLKQIKKERAFIIAFVLILLFLSVLLSRAYFLIRSKNKQLYLINIKLNNTNKLLGETVDEKQQLLKEIHHRVKNNLNLLSGLIQVQKSNIKDLSAKNILEQCLLRISVISQVHRQLLDTAHSPKVIAEEFFSHLIDNLVLTLCFSTSSIKKRISEGETEIPLKIAIPLALMINELLTNALKHGHKNQENASVIFDFNQTGNVINVSISDNGPGIKNKNIIEQPKTTGMKLINIFVKQLNAEINYTKQPNSSFNVTLTL